MKAVDTNVLARLLLADDERQHRAAVALFSRGEMLTAPVTVILELVWVLETRGRSPDEIASSLRLLLGLANFQPAAPEALGYAIDWFEGGMDFADALHLALSAGDEAFVTFDRGLARRARGLSAFPAVTVAGAD